MICNPYRPCWEGEGEEGGVRGLGVVRGRSVYVKYGHKKNCTKHIYC